MINMGRFRVWYAKRRSSCKALASRRLAGGFEPLEKRELLAALTLSASASSSAIQAGDTVQFDVDVTGGSGPYQYQWNFDDIESYKNPTTSASASHRFDYAGRHFVQVEVTDGLSNRQQAVLIIDVAIDSLMPVADAVTDIGLDNTGTLDCATTLETYIAQNYDADHGLKIEFPDGTYRFGDKTGYGDKIYAVAISNKAGAETQMTELVLAGKDGARPTLVFDDDSNSPETHTFFYMYGAGADPGFDTHVLVSNLQIEMAQDPDYYAQLPQLFYGADVYARQEHVVIEDCDLRRFGRVGHHSRAIHKRNNITESGDYDNDAGRTEILRYGQDGLSIRNYVADLDEDHSHVWYCTNASDVYLVDNYVDFDNSYRGATPAQLKLAMHDVHISGNLFENVAGGAGLRLGGYDGQAYDAEVSNNRIINAERGMDLISSSRNINIDDNFFGDLDFNVIDAGHDHAEGYPVLGVSLSGNVLGYGTPADGREFVHNRFADYGINLQVDTTESGTVNNDSPYRAGDPTGWRDANGYVNPGAYEYTPPTVNSFRINGGNASTDSRTVTLNMDVVDSGSGMGSAARFPFDEGAVMQFSNDGVHWHQVEQYSATRAWTLSEGEGEKTVYARFRDVDGNWTDVVYAGIRYASSTPQNDSPLAVDDSVATPEDWPIVIQVLANDRDADGTIHPGSVVLVASPSHGAAVVNANGTITYTPSVNFVGNDTLRYTVQDNDGATSNAAVVNISVQRTSPQIGAVGVYDPQASRFHLRDSSIFGADTYDPFVYGPGNAGWQTLMGDWDGDGIDTVGLYAPSSSTFFLNNANATRNADVVFGYGPGGLGWIPLVGDWNGDGIDTVGLYAPSSSTFFLSNANATRNADVVFGYGPGGLGWEPMVGDWNGDGVDTVGLYAPAFSAFFLNNANASKNADVTFNYGPGGLGWMPLSGDWDDNGTDTVGLYAPNSSTFFLNNSNAARNADYTFSYGPGGSGWTPLTGNWDGPAGLSLLAAGGEAPNAGGEVAVLAEAKLESIVAEAISIWADAGLSYAALDALAGIEVVVADLPGAQLGLAELDAIYLDFNAAGHGWFIDSTPDRDEEFIAGDSDGSLVAVDSDAVDRMDLLTVVTHELGHILGLEDLDAAKDSLMSSLLESGQRHRPGVAETDSIFSRL